MLLLDDGLRTLSRDNGRAGTRPQGGIATGPVIVGDQIGEGTALETAVVGETPNLAARLQALAQPNQIVVSSATRAMLGDHFDLVDLGASELKGFAEPVPAWRVLSARDVESRFAATRTGNSAPLVGRQEEMGLLLRAWDGSSRGRGQVVLIQGEAGVGKSRLVEGLREAAGQDHIWVALRCSPFHTASAFHPIIEHLKRVFGWQPEDTAPQHLAKLEAGLAGFKTLPLSESVRLFADLMVVPAPWLIEVAERAPVLMAWEDLHWADPTTLETLGMLIEQAPTAALLVVATYRPISALAGIEEDMLQSGLGQLVVDELLYQRGRPPRSRYLFKHALIQDAAYQSLLKRTRQQYHQQVANLLEDRFPEVASTQPELVAHHYTEANCPAQAIPYWLRAGAAAASKSANVEAIDQFHRGLALVEALPDMRERADRELHKAETEAYARI